MTIQQIMSWGGLLAILLSIIPVVVVGFRILWKHDLRPSFREYFTQIGSKVQQLLLLAAALFALGWVLLVMGQMTFS